MGTRIRRLPLAKIPFALALGALALAACTPVPPPTPPPSPTSLPDCGPTQTPTPEEPVEYVAVVDEPGEGAPEVETFVASSPEEKDAKVEELAEQGTVVAVDENETVSALVDPSDDPRAAEQYGLVNVAFQSAWDAGFDGTGITIAVLDTGVYAAHEDLAGKVLQGIDYSSGDDTNPAGDSDYGRIDHHGHGTHVAAIAAAIDNTVGGVGGAPGVSILPVRVLGVGGGGSISDVIDGIHWATDQGADIINMSLGGGACSSAARAAAEYAEGEGVVLVAAAGNNNSSTPVYPGGYGGSVIAAGATTYANEKSSFSNFGSPYVDLAAPGTAILSATIDPAGTPPEDLGTAYKLLSGTSMSTPFVASVVALVLQHCPAIPNGSINGASVHDKITALLQSTADPAIPVLDASLVQAGAAVAAACPS